MHATTLEYMLMAVPQLRHLALEHTGLKMHGIFLAARHCPVLMKLVLQEHHVNADETMFEMYTSYPEFFAASSSSSPSASSFQFFPNLLHLSLIIAPLSKPHKQLHHRPTPLKKEPQQDNTLILTMLSLLSAPYKLLYLELASHVRMGKQLIQLMQSQFTALKGLSPSTEMPPPFVLTKTRTACIIETVLSISVRSEAEVELEIDCEFEGSRFPEYVWDKPLHAYVSGRVLYWSKLLSLSAVSK